MKALPARIRRWWRIRFHCNLHTGTCPLCEAWKEARAAKRQEACGK